MRTLSLKGYALLVEREGLSLTPYQESGDVPTIGIGTIAYENGVHVTLKDSPITKERAYELLDFELKEKAATIEHYCDMRKLNLNDNQFSALLSFAYNLGCGPIITSGKSMNMALLSGNGIREAFMIYNKSPNWLGIRVPRKGLTIRRKMEADLYFS